MQKPHLDGSRGIVMEMISFDVLLDKLSDGIRKFHADGRKLELWATELLSKK